MDTSYWNRCIQAVFLLYFIGNNNGALWFILKTQTHLAISKADALIRDLQFIFHNVRYHNCTLTCLGVGVVGLIITLWNFIAK